VPNTPNRGYPYPTLAGANNPPVDIQQLAEAVDVDGTAFAAAFTARGSFLEADSTTAQTGGAGVDWTYTTCEVVLTPGTWQVQGSAALYASTAEAGQVALWNQTAGTEIPNSAGPATYTTTSPDRRQLTSRPVVITTAANMAVRLRIKRNGAGTLTVSPGIVGGVAATLDALRVK
jgi:hypothetical protein